jgi:hypothetical protein
MRHSVLIHVGGARIFGCVTAFLVAVFLTNTPCRPEELKSGWCDFKASIAGKFDLMLSDDQKDLLYAHRRSSKYLVSWFCERTNLRALPDKAGLCSERQNQARRFGARFIECVFERDPVERFVRVFAFMKTRQGMVIEGVYVARTSRLTVSVSNYGLSRDDQLELFERVIGGIRSVSQ